MERKKYIDIAKYIAIFMVMVEHTGLFADLGGAYTNLKIWICSCHMPAFFVLFGMVATADRTQGAEAFFCLVEKRFKSLIVPYFLWCMICASSLNGKLVLGSVYGTNPSLGYASTNMVLWFLPAMFCAAILFQICVNILSCAPEGKRRICCVAELVFCGLTSLLLKQIRPQIGIPFGMDIAFTGTVFMLAGYLIRGGIDGKVYHLPKEWIFLVGVISLVAGFVLAQYNPPTEIWASTMALACYGKSYPLYIISAVVSSVGIICISMLLERVRLFSWFGENTMPIMALHSTLFPYTVPMITHRLGGYPIAASFVNAIVCSAMLLPIVFLIDKYAPVLKGKTERGTGRQYGLDKGQQRELDVMNGVEKPK